MTQLTDEGLVVSRLDERVAELTAAIQAIFGPGLDLSPNTVDGQTIGTFAESINNLDQLLEEVYQGINPQSSVGPFLSRIVQFNGITRIPGTYSTVTLTLGGTASTPIPAGSLFHSTATNTIFSTDTTVVIPNAGVIDVAATATVIGAQAAPAGTITAIDTPIFGLQTATNADDAAVGRNTETDQQLRIRRAKSTAYPSQTVVDGIEAGVANIENVTHARVYENDQPVVDVTTGQAKNSFYVVVLGGDDQDIRQAILLKKTGGIPTLGTVTGYAIDSRGRSQLIKFSRPTIDPIYITVNVSKRVGFPTDGAAQIAAAILAYGNENYEIGQEVIQSDFYGPIASIPAKSITSLFIGTAPGPTGTANISTLYDHLAGFDASRIVVNVT